MGISTFVLTAYCNGDFSFVPERNFRDILSKETGHERIKRMYTMDEFGYSPELAFVIKTGLYSVAFAGFYGGVKGIHNAQTEFHRKNVATTFESAHLARRSLTDKMTIAGLQGAAKYGLKYGGFSSFYLLSTFTIANYWNKITPWEHAGSAALAGGFSRINFGFKGMLAASMLGGTIGLLAGTLITASMKIFGITMDDLRCWQHEDHYLRLRKLDKKEY